MSKHTPGPWETLTYANHELQTDYVMVKIGGQVHMVGHLNEDKANARLIAAAPDLLAAAKNLLAMTEGQTIYNYMKLQLEAVRAAIAKAEGETP